MLFRNASELRRSLDGVVSVKGNEVVMHDGDRLRSKAIERWVHNAVLHPHDDLRYFLRWLIRKCAAAQAIYPASATGLYAAMVTRGATNFSLPVFNLRVLPYDSARAIFRAVRTHQAGAFGFQVAEGIPAYSLPDADEFATCILGAAIKEHYQGPVFLYGGFLQADPDGWERDRDNEMSRLMALAEEALEAGIFNLDIDGSTLLDETRSDPAEMEADNIAMTAELAAHVRHVAPPEAHPTLGGTVSSACLAGHPAQGLRHFVEEVNSGIADRAPGSAGLAKLLARTAADEWPAGITEGPMIVAPAKIGELAEVARRSYGLVTAAHGGISGVDDNTLAWFPGRVEELHLLSLLDNTLFDHPEFPAGLKEAIYHWVDGQLIGQRLPEQPDEQFFLEGRLLAAQPFRRELWEIPAASRTAIMAAVEAQAARCLRLLNVATSAGLVRDVSRLHDVPVAAPTAGYHGNAESLLGDILDYMRQPVPEPPSGYPEGLGPR